MYAAEKDKDSTCGASTNLNLKDTDKGSAGIPSQYGGSFKRGSAALANTL